MLPLLLLDDALCISEHLRETKYTNIQYCPFGEHGDLYKGKILDLLLRDEQRIIERARNKKNILYEHCFSQQYYASMAKIDGYTLLLKRIFCDNVSFSTEDLESLPHGLKVLVTKYAISTPSGALFPFRFAPYEDMLLLADPVWATEADAVFLFRDSFLLSEHIKSHLNDCLINGNRPRQIIDCGTGSGVLALVAAKTGIAPVSAFDVNPRAIQAASINAVINRCPIVPSFQTRSLDQVSLSESFVVSNPPYMCIPNEPSLCLHGGDHLGMDFAVRLIRKCVVENASAMIILSVPLLGETNSFERELSDCGGLSKTVLSPEPLFSEIKSHAVLMEQGATERELTVYALNMRQ